MEGGAHVEKESDKDWRGMIKRLIAQVILGLAKTIGFHLKHNGKRWEQL